MKTALALLAGLTAAVEARADSPIDHMQGEWYSTTTIFDAGEDGQDLILQAHQRCERSGTTGFMCVSRSLKGAPVLSLFWSIEPDGEHTHGYTVHHLEDTIQSRRGVWSPKTRTWKEYSPGPEGGLHIHTHFSEQNQFQIKVFGDTGGEPAQPILEVAFRR